MDHASCGGRTAAQRTQHKLWQELGSLYRLRVNLSNLARPAGGFRGTALQQRVLDAAEYVVYDLIKDTRNRMKTIPKTPKK